MTNNCLNCNAEIAGNFCSNCSQATTTHRFSLAHVIEHDFIHGIFHFDKGFFYTISQLFTRPGHSIREYVQGKRARHFNYFATIILLLTISYFLKKSTRIDASAIFDGDTTEGLFKVLKDYSKITAFLHIPVVAFISYLFFKQSKQNYTENLVLNLYLLCGQLTISLLFPIAMIISDNKEFIYTVNYVLSIFTFLYIAIFYYQYFSVYNLAKHKLIIRSILIAVLYLVIKQVTNNVINYIGVHYL
jgi:hypothetical protein